MNGSRCRNAFILMQQFYSSDSTPRYFLHILNSFCTANFGQDLRRESSIREFSNLAQEILNCTEYYAVTNCYKATDYYATIKALVADNRRAQQRGTVEKDVFEFLF